MSKCGTPLYRELTKLLNDQMMTHVRQLCEPSAFKTGKN